MKQALRQLLSDFLSAILFLVVYGLSGNLFAAAAIAVAAGMAQFAYIWATGRRVEPMQWMSLGLVVVLGSATMLTQSPRFIMVKPTIVHLAVAVVMLLVIVLLTSCTFGASSSDTPAPSSADTLSFIMLL